MISFWTGITVLCPVCWNNTRTKIQSDAIFENFPLFCPKCIQKTLIEAKHL
ncbi:MAG: cysteine-rich KTR domain-containing protein [Clostridiales bacterium]|nr:cysteine-rich KTR domain-containing protein [Clostridiales bacterium]MDY4172531.1 cysteine-rich KTR domain-containing protein [Evtepia sp.]